ncbi:MAG TPA: VWA domain-containing protein [Terriglobales bacterium]|jgi:VWFA-related protein|nr:VWA domain-containing protein [Terriglobales bacterium]
MPKACSPSVLRVAVLLLLFPGLSAAGAQQSASSPDQSRQDQDQDQSATTLKVNVNVVQLFFNVKDKRGALIPNLTKNDFQILEDGKPQAIKYFAAESNLPLTLGILIDSSGSQARVLDMEKQVGGDFLNQILREKDLAFVIDFDVNVELLQDFTSSVRLLKTALNSARINTAGGSGTGIPGLGGGTVPTVGSPRGTLLYDAVYLASHDELAQQVGRKAMILLTDGQDEGSQLKIKDAIEAAQKSDSIVYVLLCADRGFYGGFGGYSGEGEMKKLTQETGGRVIEVGNKYEKLKEGFDQIANELRSQYNIGYNPTNAALDGTFRKIEIRASNKDYKIQSRAGYYAVPKRD